MMNQPLLHVRELGCCRQWHQDLRPPHAEVIKPSPREYLGRMEARGRAEEAGGVPPGAARPNHRVMRLPPATFGAALADPGLELFVGTSDLQVLKLSGGLRPL
jgi:hypothetical protein